MTLVIDKKGQLWKIDRWDQYVIHRGPAPVDAVVIQAEFEDGFTATSEEYATAFGTLTELIFQNEYATMSHM